MQFIRRLPILCAHIGTRLLLHVGTRNLNLSSSITSLSQVECDFLFLFFFFRPITIYQFSCSHKLCRLAQRCHVLYILPKKYRQLARSHFILDSLAKIYGIDGDCKFTPHLPSRLYSYTESQFMQWCFKNNAIKIILQLSCSCWTDFYEVIF